MPELLNSLHCRNVKDLCFKRRCTRHCRAAPPPCPPLPHSKEKPLTDIPSLQLQTTLLKHRLIPATASPSSPCVTQRKNIKWEGLRNWWQTGPPTSQIPFLTAQSNASIWEIRSNTHRCISPGFLYPTFILFSLKNPLQQSRYCLEYT